MTSFLSACIVLRLTGSKLLRASLTRRGKPVTISEQETVWLTTQQCKRSSIGGSRDSMTRQVKFVKRLRRSSSWWRIPVEALYQPRWPRLLLR